MLAVAIKGRSGSFRASLTLFISHCKMLRYCDFGDLEIWVQNSGKWVSSDNPLDDFSSVLDDPGFLEGPNQDSVQWQSNTSDTMQSINAISNRFDKKEPDVKNSCVEIEGGKLQIMKVRKFREKPLAVLPLVLLNDEDKKHSLSQQLKPQKVEAIEDSSIETP